LNEVGLDPGIDHLLAMECFDEVHQAGGKVESFISFCGGEYDYCIWCVPPL
jgi:Saccharopine dehydrogenase and related proteins